MKKKDFMKVCRMDQQTVKDYCVQKLIDAGYPFVNEQDGFVYAKGNIPVLVTAHMDTVHEKLPKHIKITDGIMSSPNGIGGDDRCGIYIILNIISETDLRPSVLFCEDEECGGIGSGKFIKTEFVKDLAEFKFLIEVDRQGKSDAVFYNCGNYEFIKWIEKETGFREAFGTFSDISNLSPACDVASVNLSCGYYKQHTKDEYVVWSEMCHSRDVILGLIKAGETCEAFDYQEEKYDYFDYYGYSNEHKTQMVSVYILYEDKNGQQYDCEYYGCNESEAFGDFFIDNPDICFNNILDWYST